MVALNPNWPILEIAWGAMWPCDGGVMPTNGWVDLSNRRRAELDTQRGRQYELDQVRTAEADIVLANPDGHLDPSNASGPWAGHLTPYQPFRMRAQWPPTVNLLTPAQATAEGLAAGLLPSSAVIFSVTDSTGGSAVASASAWQGSQVLQFAVPASTPPTPAICNTGQPSVEPGITYSMQMRVRDVTPSTSVTVELFIQWLDAEQDSISVHFSGTAALTGATNAAWTTLTITATAPVTAAGAWWGVALAATSPAAALNVQVDGWQLERAATPSTFVAPNAWSPVYAGYVERWPQIWDLDGTYGLVQATAVDAFALLSQVQLTDPLTAEITSRNPAFLYTLGDPAKSGSFADATGNYPPAPIENSKYGKGTVTSGNKITSASAGGTYASSNTVVTFANPFPGETLGPASYISLTEAGIAGPANPNLWTRMIAFRTTVTTLPVNEYCLWSAMDWQRGTDPDGSYFKIHIDSTGHISTVLAGPNGSQYVIDAPAGDVCDSNWHLVTIAFDKVNGLAGMSLDGVAIEYNITGFAAPTGMIGDSIGTFLDLTDGNGSANNFGGDISYVAEFPVYYYTTDMATIYQAWRNACAGESSGARYSRILRYAGYTGPANIDVGATTNMGPADDISGTDAVSALQAVVDTENGAHFVDRAGAMTFQGRGRRYNQGAPVYTFGEDVSGGEYPYEDVGFDDDPTHLANLVEITQHSTGQIFKSLDATSRSNYFPRVLTRTSNAAVAAECQSSADYLISRYKQPTMRLLSLTLNPSAYPDLWPVCLALELGVRVRVNRRPPAASKVTVDCFVEAINFTIDDETQFIWTLQGSPVDLTPYGVFGALHTTLATAAHSGDTTITIKPGSDAVNAPISQIPIGQTLWLWETPNTVESVTVTAVEDTGSNWTTCDLTLSASLSAAHASGIVVSDVLPSGVNDPAFYDSSDIFGSLVFSY